MKLEDIIEAALFASPHPLSPEELCDLFDEFERPPREAVLAVLEDLARAYEGRSVELRQVATGYRFQIRAALSPWVSRLFEEKPVRYSRALFETLAIIAYRQPVTRGEIEDIRGVAVSSTTVRTLLERDWIHVVGYREVPGRPALYATTKEFLNYFNLQSLDQLPALPSLPEAAPELPAPLGLLDKE